MIGMDEDEKRHLLEIFRHLNLDAGTVVGLSAIADHWRGDSAALRRTLERLLAEGLVEIRHDGYCLTQAGKMALS